VTVAPGALSLADQGCPKASPHWFRWPELESSDKLKRAEAIRERLQRAPARRRARSHARLTRTILLGTVAVALAIACLADAYGVQTKDLLNALAASLAFVGVFAALALTGGLLLGGARRLLGRRRDNRGVGPKRR